MPKYVVMYGTHKVDANKYAKRGEEVELSEDDAATIDGGKKFGTHEQWKKLQAAEKATADAQAEEAKAAEKTAQARAAESTAAAPEPKTAEKPHTPHKGGH